MELTNNPSASTTPAQPKSVSGGGLPELRAALLRAALRGGNLQDYFEFACRSMVESGCFRAAGIGRLTSDLQPVEWLAQSGDESAKHASLGCSALAGCEANDALWQALGQGQAYVSGAILTGPTLGAWPIRQPEGAILVLLALGFDPDLLDDPMRPALDGMASDVSHAVDHLEKEDRARQVEAGLRVSLTQKEALLREVHHRVKNNLQIVTSLLNLQAARVADVAVRDALRETQHRVRSMALLHEALYRSENLARLDFARYAEQLCAHLLNSHAVRPGRIIPLVRVEDVALSLDQAVPCGLVISELVSNALKHAFPADRPGRITVEMQRTGDSRIVLKVADDGLGLPESFDITKAPTLGLRLVRILTDQLRGALTVSREGGAAFSIAFPAQVG